MNLSILRNIQKSSSFVLSDLSALEEIIVRKRNSMTGYDDFAETFGASRRDMHWEETQVLLDDFVESFEDIETWKIAYIGCGNGRLLRHIASEPKILSLFQSHHTHYF